MELRTPKILFVVTSAPRIGPNARQTGYEFSEVAHPYLVLHAAGCEIDFASPLGGQPPSDGFDASDAATRIFRSSPGFKDLNRSLCLEDVQVDQYDAVFFPGGLGPMVDLAVHKGAKDLIARTWSQGKVVAAVCHGPVALVDVMVDGKQLVEGKHLTCFTTLEEQGHSENDVPYMLDQRLASAGAILTSASPFENHVVVDGRLITGQNPASATGVAEAILKALEYETEALSVA